VSLYLAPAAIVPNFKYKSISISILRSSSHMQTMSNFKHKSISICISRPSGHLQTVPNFKHKFISISLFHIYVYISISIYMSIYLHPNHYFISMCICLYLYLYLYLILKSKNFLFESVFIPYCFTFQIALPPTIFYTWLRLMIYVHTSYNNYGVVSSDDMEIWI
jgi:hypothetical protein